ncbi:choice-of-anchor P family protein [Amycolatopsis sp. H20-H5]|uniref:choice-of-anchor P family protein n=1 Tax=Amycolatopsis sp. H20-H5 TaxID=3046309 RepID=UPI002DC0418F|nr:choice-of-anchor P family protein [Amycolatopsis sp. H20-H5]MEC3980067.1 choice-of-anchor P family protein [Amycolatopsis sp. H20-H5]
MRPILLRSGGLVVTATVAALIATAVPASAATGGASAYGVQVTVTLLGQPAVTQTPIPVANATGPTSASLASLTVPGVLSASALQVNATQNPTTGEDKSSATVGRATLGLLTAAAGGTAPSASAITATCDATQAGEQGSTTIGTLNLGTLGNGSVGANIAPNTTIALHVGTITIATLVLNEQIHNPDGSLTVNGLHLTLLTGGLGAIGSGDVILSSATCGPAALPTPIASGIGLWTGLSLLAAVGVAVGLLRRRRANA